jgi:beta-lactamase superfamily II metal-dependent hydrolase
MKVQLMKRFLYGSLIAFIIILFFAKLAYAQELFVRVIDVGPGLSCAIKFPNDKYMIYDAGTSKKTYNAITGVIPIGSEIELMVLSHTDSDHIAAVPQIMDNYKVKQVIRTGLKRGTDAWRQADSTIINNQDCEDINLREVDFEFGKKYQYGDVVLTLIAGWHQPPDKWGFNESSSEWRNAGSIVIRLEYAGKSILFTGDTVGRLEDAPDTTCIAAEKYMVDNASNIPIDSDILIAPHHGADNGSSYRFIEAVSPIYVIFPSGGKYGHPRSVTATRYLKHVNLQNIFRTDLGNNETSKLYGYKEWKYGSDPLNKDKTYDDNVNITINSTSEIKVNYFP